jgi:radical SAM protein (TIGR01212 family)
MSTFSSAEANPVFPKNRLHYRQRQQYYSIIPLFPVNRKFEMDGRLPYRAYSQYLRERFGECVYRICLDAGFGCPNRDGTIGRGGCVYCQDRGSWGGGGRPRPLEEQIRIEKERVRTRYGARLFIAYFQAHTNTHAPAPTLRKIYDAAVEGDREIVGLAIGTRPDCIDREKLELIASYRNGNREVWIEYGLQSAHDETLELIGRGHDVQSFTDAVQLTREYGIGVFAHLIIGLPGEGRSRLLETAEYLAGLPIDGVKLHNLNIIRGTPLEEWMREGRISPLPLEEYAERVVDFLERTSPDVVVARLTADTAPGLLIAPLWSLDKGEALRRIRQTFDRRSTYQGRFYGNNP